MDDHIDIPQSFWERMLADKKRLAYIGVGALVLVALVVAAAIKVAGDRPPVFTPADRETPEASEQTPSVETSSAAQTGSPAATSSPVPPKTTASVEAAVPANTVRKPVIAFRRDGALWICAESGADAKKVADAKKGTFALSPDAATLAYVDPDTRSLHLVDLASGKAVRVGSAENASLCWAPGSEFVLYTAKSPTRYEVRKTLRDGRGDTVLGVGHSPHVSGGGSGLTWIADSPYGQPGMVTTTLFTATRPSSRLGAPLATEAAFAVDGVVVSVGGAPGTARIITMAHDGALVMNEGSSREIVGAPSGARPVSYAHLCASPATQSGSSSSAGRYLAYAEVGDDGYSRSYIYDSVEGRSVALSMRKDTYPLCWSADGKRLFVVEGNAFQGEATAIVSTLPDGMGRVTVVQGGGL